MPDGDEFDSPLTKKPGSDHPGFRDLQQAFGDLRSNRSHAAPYAAPTRCQESPKANGKKAFEMKKTTYQLTFDDAVDIWQRHWNGEFQHRIAAAFDVNPGRVNEVLKGSRHAGSREVAEARKMAA